MRAKRILVALYFCSIVLLIALLVFPIRSGLIRLLIVGSAAAVFAGAAIWVRPWRVKCLLLGGLALAIGAVALLPARPIDAGQLRNQYVQALRSYDGTRYVWGGENQLGIDCSGIVRAAWVDCQFRLGIKTANPQLLRSAFEAWWFDSSARNLSSGYSGRTRELHSGKSVRANEDRGLLPGDFALVANGVHALAYLRDQKWIEADPC